MDYIRRSLDILQGKLPTDENSFNHALKEIQDRKKELIPLVNELLNKGIKLRDVCSDLNNEWDEIVLTLIKYENYDTKK